MKILKHTWLLILLVLPSIASSQGEIYQIGNANDYVAGVTSERFRYVAARQKSQNWCWAACVQMVLNYQGLDVDQCDIVKEGFGQSRCVDAPADCYDIQRAAGGWNINGRRIRSSVNTNFSNVHKLINDLAYKYPLIVGLDMPGQRIGHAYVLTAIFYQYDSRDRKIPYKVVLRDPWPSNPSRQEISWREFQNRLNCITHVTF
jgi:hypothetical protein